MSHVAHCLFEPLTQFSMLQSAFFRTSIQFARKYSLFDGNWAQCSTESASMIEFLAQGSDKPETMDLIPRPERTLRDQRRKFAFHLFSLKVVCSSVMNQTMEMVSNIHHKKFGLNVQRNGPQPSICVR
jgi:hypothetical protein